MAKVDAVSFSDRPLLVYGGVLVDDITFADGRRLEGVLGGAALHAVAGAALWDAKVLLMGGVGRDAETHLIPWLRANDLSTAGLHVRGAVTPRNALVYHKDGSRHETPAFGAKHFHELQPSAMDLAAALQQARAAYVFKEADPNFWQPVLWQAARSATTILWEISAESCVADAVHNVADVARQVSALSLNYAEAIGLFGDKPLPALLDDVRDLGAGIAFLRCGAEGSVVIWPAGSAVVPAWPAAVVDETGAGNAYGGAVLVGLARGCDPVTAARMGAISAAHALSQHGLFEPAHPESRSRAAAALQHDGQSDA